MAFDTEKKLLTPKKMRFQNKKVSGTCQAFFSHITVYK